MTRLPQIIAFSLLSLSCSLPNACHAQIRVLSAGSPGVEWQSTQLELLKSQLADETVTGPLREELEAQHQWLEHWKPGTMTDKPAWDSKLRVELKPEPIVDPNKLATALRQRLLGPQAQPTVRDTEALEAHLSKYPDDVGVRQLHLHWLDQKQYRKQYAEEIADASIRLAGLLEQLKPQTEEMRRAIAYCLYRRARALVYRELPDVIAKNPLKDPEEHHAVLMGAYHQLEEYTGGSRPEFILLDVRMLRKDHYYGRALRLLTNYAAVIERQWFLKKRRDLLKELGWQLPYQEAAKVYADAYPEAAAEENVDEDA